MNALLAGVMFSDDHGLPIRVLSPAVLAISNSFGEFKPLPPMNGCFMPKARVCRMMLAASSARQEQTMASGLLALILVNCALKSTSPLAYASVVVVGIFCCSRVALKTS